MSASNSRKDKVTAEKIDMVLKTRAAFDDRTALRFAELSGVPEALAREVLDRAQEHTRPSTEALPLNPPRER